jgi:hypothetical protein
MLTESQNNTAAARNLLEISEGTETPGNNSERLRWIDDGGFKRLVTK